MNYVKVEQVIYESDRYDAVKSALAMAIEHMVRLKETSVNIVSTDELTGKLNTLATLAVDRNGELKLALT